MTQLRTNIEEMEGEDPRTKMAGIKESTQPITSRDTPGVRVMDAVSSLRPKRQDGNTSLKSSLHQEPAINQPIIPPTRTLNQTNTCPTTDHENLSQHNAGHPILSPHSRRRRICSFFQHIALPLHRTHHRHRSFSCRA